MEINKLFENEKQHRSLPFWSWNDKLEEDEIRRQVDIMNDAKNGGFFMHARGGLETEYLGEDWYKMVAASVDEAKKLGMDAWAYDENGWPSGFADGKVPSRGFEYWQKRLTRNVLTDETAPQYAVAYFFEDESGYQRTDSPKKGAFAYFMEVNKYYIDAFNPDSIKCFIEETHEEYFARFKDEFGKTLKGFFTDEPQYNNTPNFPWSHILEDEFKRRYGYSLIANLPALFGSYKNSTAVKYDYWKMVGELFRVNFLKQVQDWCHEHNCKLTGHVMSDVSLDGEVKSVGDSMSCYEYFDIPGIDWLGRAIGKAVAAKQLSSVAAQLDKPTVTESFALCGWDVSPNDLRLIAGWQFVNGISMICQHLEAYTLRGIRKRDYPAALFMQLPWYNRAYGALNTYFSKVGSLITAGVENAPVLVIHPIFTASLLYKDNDSSDITEYSEHFDWFSDKLNDEHILHHYGSEPMMKAHARVEGKKFIIGCREYETVLIPKVSVLSGECMDLLLEFAKNGGEIFAIKLPETVDGREDDRIEILRPYCKMIGCDEVCKLHTESMPSFFEGKNEVSRVHIAERIMGDEKYYYIINLSEKEKKGTFKIKGDFSLCELDVLSEQRTAINFKNGEYTSALLTFAPYEAKVILAEKSQKCLAKTQTEYLKLDKNFKVKDSSHNMLTLDFCEYSIDGGEWQPSRAVILLFKDLLSQKKPCNLKMRFNFEVCDIPSSLNLLLETPQKFKIFLNGESVDFADIGYEVDKSFRKCDIKKYVKAGKNEITLECEFYQRQKVYDVLYGENVHETELNKLTYDTEIESIYLTGDFAVETKDEVTYGERRSIFAGENFVITAPKTQVDCTELTTNGYLFFAGNITLENTLSVSKKPGVAYKIKFSALNAPCAELFLNGKSAGLYMFAPYELDVTDLLCDGENEVRIVLYSGNRNMLGPHHKPCGECYDVGPSTFTDVYGWSDDRSQPAWTDSYSFVKFGIEL